MGDRKFRGAQAVAMSALRVDVKLRGDLCFLERLKVSGILLPPSLFERETLVN